MVELKQRPKVQIRQLSEQDIEGVLSIDRRISGKGRAVTYTSAPESYVGGDMDVSVVAEAGGEIVGFLLGRITESPLGTPDRALLQLIGIDPEFQRQGIGSRLVNAFAQSCRQKGVRSLHIMVSWHDWWLLSFLSALGFTHGQMTEFVKSIDTA